MNLQQSAERKRAVLLLGNEAIALGAYHAGAVFGSGYPGTPSTEILENFSRFPEVVAEWAPNEKCAYEAAYGASIAGARSIVTMKHVGLNVAADPFVTSVYSGVNGGLVLIVADDPGMHSSQNEQDSRHYARLAKAPCFEPSDPDEAYRMIIEAFRVSEQYDTPVMLRSLTRVSHSTGVVYPVEPEERNMKAYSKNVEKYVMVPAYARRRKKAVLERIKALKDYSEKTGFNFIEPGRTDIGIIASGPSYLYAKEALPEASFLKLGFSYPLPEKLILEFSRMVEKILVVEEVDSVLEVELKALGLNVYGKEFIPEEGELNPEIVAEGIKEFLGGKGFYQIPWESKKEVTDLPVRMPVLCPGCGHRNLFFVLKKLRAPIMGDIGCYTLAVNAPLESMDTCTCMGAGIGEAHGYARVRNSEGDRKPVAVIGDSTFVHSGITGIINAAYNKADALVVILDNRTTAMTGHQPHPGTGKTIRNEETFELDFEKLSKACGAQYVAVVDPYDLKETERVLKEAYAVKGLSVVIARRPCVLYERTTFWIYRIDLEKCTDCGLCLMLGCPAIQKDGEKVKIDEVLCTGCGACFYLCRFDAIFKVEEE
jgi:indolepyruvate ferredoxin oxidoreductase alpha subunit